MKEKFIENGIEYVKCGDYYIPNLTAPTEHYQIGSFGKRHERYIKQHHKAFYTTLFMTGKLFEYLAEIDRQTYYLEAIKEFEISHKSPLKVYLISDYLTNVRIFKV